MPLSHTPTYNLKAVLNETGLAADTLRAWERRYGLPRPQRTPGGHRLYSQHDIHVIKWLVARQAEGLSISRAVKQWDALVASGTDPLAGSETAQFPGATGSAANLDAACREWLSAGLRFDERGAEQVLNQSFALHTVETIATDVILRGLHEAGERWQHAQSSVQQEHFISAMAIRRLNTLIASAPLPAQAGAIVLACPPAELHSLPLLYLELMLRRRGRNVISLGADVPLEHLEEMVRSVRAVLVVMGAQRLATAATLRHAAALLAAKRVPIAYGGQVFNRVPQIREHIAGQFLSEALELSLDPIEELLARPIQIAEHHLGPGLHVQAFQTARLEIESAVQRNLRVQLTSGTDLAMANSYFGGALTGALELGDVSFLTADMSWIRPLLMKPQLPFDQPHTYLAAYARATREALGEAGKEVADWLERYAERA